MNPLVRTALLAGIMTGAGCFIFSVLIYAVGMNPLMQHKFLFLPLYGIGMILAMRYYRINFGDGLMPTWKGIVIGLIINLMASALYAVMLYMLLSRIDDGMLKLYQQTAIVFFENNREEMIKNSSKEQFEAMRRNIDLMTPGAVAFDEWISKSMFGLILSVLTALAMRKRVEPVKE